MVDNNGLLVLTRFRNQKIMIGNDVVITILSVNGKQVKIGIEAPRDVEVHREEIYAKIKMGIES